MIVTIFVRVAVANQYFCDASQELNINAIAAWNSKNKISLLTRTDKVNIVESFLPITLSDVVIKI